jgi:hypothetical protein
MNATASFKNNAWNSLNWLLAALGLTLAPPARAATPPAAIPFSAIGARATAGYQGDALGVTATSDGARLRCGFQKLEGHATPEGLWLESTKPGAAGKLRIVATALGRDSSRARECALTEPDVLALFAPTDVGGYTALATIGKVSAGNKLVRFTRPGLTEEYSVSVDGVRQDFIIESPPLNPPPSAVLSTLRSTATEDGLRRTGQRSTLNQSAGDLRVELALSGARAEAAAGGARLSLEGSGRALVYSRLRVEDATGRELTARLEVLSSDRLAVNVADGGATYPVRIDPMFSDANWVSLNPGMPGADGTVEALAVDDSGNLYIGGRFTFVGTAFASGVAKWDGTTWSALGSGMTNDVYALAVSGTNLYAGGMFTTAGGVPANYIAKWDGSAWSALGSGVGSTVRALAVSGTNLYAGGMFYTAGGVTANQIAKWNGSAWSALSSGMNNYVWALAVIGTNLLAGGEFTTAGGVAANYIAKWDGSAWSALGSGVGYDVLALAVSGTNLYAGGEFTTAGGVAANHIAKWDGSAWSALGSGVGDDVLALAVSGTDLYAGGYFGTAGGVPVNGIAKWNGSAWSALGSGMTGGYPIAVAATGTNLYAGGNFSTAGGQPASGIAMWNGSAWSALGSGIDAAVWALAVSGTSVYAGGLFTAAGGLAVNSIAKWDGSAWSALGSGVTDGSGSRGNVNALAVSGTDLYAAGAFITAGGLTVSNISKWDGNSWSALSSGMNGTIVRALAASGTDLYAGGYFTTAGGATANYIAKWDGSTWSALGSGLNGCVYALAVSGTNLFAGGVFTTAGGVAANYIAKWDGSAWSALGAGVNTYVYALAVSGTTLYAGGDFTGAGGLTASYVAKWDGTAWSALGSGMNSTVMSLAVSGTNLFAGGVFTTAGGQPASGIAMWNGSTWSALGSGVSSPYVDALAADSAGHLFAGGNFYLAGTNVSPFIAEAVPNLGIVQQPTNQTVLPGSTVEFTVTATGSPTLFYQWFFNATNPVSGVSAYCCLELTNVQPWQAGTYTVVITNGYGAVTSAPALLSLIGAGPPTIVTNPLSQTAGIGGTVDFSVAAVGLPPLSYYWLFNATNGQGTGTDLHLANVQLAQTGAYTVIVSNYYGAVTSAPAWLTVTGIPPAIVSAPMNLSRRTGGTAVFSVTASGTLPLACQWYFGTSAVAQATNSTLQLTNLQPWQAGGYTVVVTNLYGAATSAPAMLEVTPPAVVTTSSEAALRAALAGGGNISFACDGTIVLSSTITNDLDATLDATGHQVTISGNGAVRVFCVNPNVSFTAINWTISDGKSLGGSAILNLGGTVNLTGVSFRSNTATMPVSSDSWSLSPMPYGGAIFNWHGTVNATNCSFATNIALTPVRQQQSSDGNPSGGAIFNEHGQLNLRSCAFVGNRAVGGGGGLLETGSPTVYGDPAWGGAIDNEGSATLDLCTFVGNSATGGHGGGAAPGTECNGAPGAEGHGGAIYNSGDGTLTMDRTAIIGNTVTGGAGGYGSAGSGFPPGDGWPGGAGGEANGGGICNAGSVWITSSTFASNVVTAGRGGGGGGGNSGSPYISANGAAGAPGGSGYGGALSGGGSLVNCTFAGNVVTGGAGGEGGPASGFPGVGSGNGGAGGNGGSGDGGAFSGGAGLVNCTVAYNAGSGGVGGTGGPGTAYHGLWGNGGSGGYGGSGLGGVSGTCNLTNCTVAGNSGYAGSGGAGGAASSPGSPGAPGTSGAAGGTMSCGSMPNTLIASNTPAGGDSFPDPGLGPLADNGGPTLTMALLPGSPAIDAGNTSLAPATDQRGFPRPAGLAADIGAFEYGSVMPTVTISRSGAYGLNILGCGNAGQPCQLLSSTDMVNWVPIASSPIGSGGTIQFIVNCAPGGACRFYRLVMP